jgi:hypothetical protein
LHELWDGKTYMNVEYDLYWEIHLYGGGREGWSVDEGGLERMVGEEGRRD